LEAVDAVVAGAGVVGLATARALALAGREVLVLEAAAGIGEESSSRNSEVIHAGIYYATGSLKARTCVAGRDSLYRFCAERGVPHRRLGKLIVATDGAELATLQAIRAKALANGVDDLRPLVAAEVHALEPELDSVGALLSPSTGIVDSHAYMLALLAEAEAQGAVLACRTPVLRGSVADEGFVLDTGGEAPMQLGCRLLVNAAGHGAWNLARNLRGLAQSHLPPYVLAKGNYFLLQGRQPFRHLVYPVPVEGGLGVHLTLDLAGQARFGPDVEWVTAFDYSVDPARTASFYPAIRRYWPALPDGALQPAYSGLRPKLSGPGQPAADFMVQGPAQHGVPGLVQLFGIESPGLTASLALAELVRRTLLDAG
jgi:L-2-hydroxyglutarate oxidase LhgO